MRVCVFAYPFCKFTWLASVGNSFPHVDGNSPGLSPITFDFNTRSLGAVCTLNHFLALLPCLNFCPKEIQSGTQKFSYAVSI
ncbi:hypothetical protein EDD18DRAFT_1170552 [Armillaria luteobubalina]|uniref:Uncharacterized protein n=1 Tax=Armillaria luteobubalina TaxID=153913 RepID=A0AA39Q3Y9_9AGAR|nr:hypothetical protein EDD18DRAFT_1170552 [Armillaria luteobubalina]